jgi:lipopolysaccharide/colanic/teichoic acid biosynthesis glycosyltransferase
MNRTKRIFDLALALPGLAVAAPLIAVSAAAIKIEDRGPVFFRQVRVGRHGRRFHMWKLRTMSADAESRGPQLTRAGDRRVTRVGAALRAAKLDELPQLLNVVRGDMSLVGPRPEVPRYVELYDDAQRSVLELTPGITDPASIKFAREGEILAKAADPERMYVEEIMPEKIRLNLEYARRATPASDLAIVLSTFSAIL